MAEHPDCIPFADLGQDHRLWNLQALGGHVLANPLRHEHLPIPGAAWDTAPRAASDGQLIHEPH